MGDPSTFNYEDADTYQNEICEIYSYCEESEFFANRNAFEEFMEDCGLPLTWEHMVKEQKWTAIDHILSSLDLSCRTTRIKSCRAICYLIQGNFGECTTLEQQMETSHQNVFLLYEQNIFQIFVQQLLIEAEYPTPSSELQRNGANAPLNQIYVDSTELRVILSVLCTITETMYHAKDNPNQRIQDLRQQFIMELQTPFGGELFAVTLFQLLDRFCSGCAPHYPVKKLTILLWKVILLSLGGNSAVKQIKNNYRTRLNLPIRADDTLEVAKTMRPCSPPLWPNGQPRSKPALGSTGPFGGKRKVFKQTAFDDAVFSYALRSFSDKISNDDGNKEGEVSYNLNVMKREALNYGDESGADEKANDLINIIESQKPVDDETAPTSDGSDSSDSGINNVNDNEELNDHESSNTDMDIDDVVKVKADDDEKDSQERSSSDIEQYVLNAFKDPDPKLEEEAEKLNSEDSESGFGNALFANIDPPTSLRTPSPQPKSLPWAPKVKNSDLKNHMINIRQKHFGYSLDDDYVTFFGLPDFIVEGINIMKKHMYVTLADLQLRQEEAMTKYPVTHKELFEDYRDAPVERLYYELLPKMPQYVIALLKILLAASTPTKKNERTESIYIMSEIDPDCDDGSVQQGMKSHANINRYKEIVIKAVSSTLILLLKHFKNNHIYQFEYVTQQMMFANCIPLVLKFLSQDVYTWVTDPKSDISLLDFPECVIGESPVLASVLLQLWTKETYSRRNMFSCINMVRILNKLVKEKHSRVMMLVVFKSAPTLIKALHVRHPVFQLYVLKLLKMQLKFMGRPWKKNNMKLISLIYSKVRHRMTDDWAYSNDNEAKPWDFQSEEFSLQSNIHKFHQRRYQHLLLQNKSRHSAIFNNIDRFNVESYENNEFLEDFSNKMDFELSTMFEANYERWLENEVFKRDTDWSGLLDAKVSSNQI